MHRCALIQLISLLLLTQRLFSPGCPCGTAAPGCDSRGNWSLARQFLWGDSDKFPDPVGMMDHTGAGGVSGTGPDPLDTTPSPARGAADGGEAAASSPGWPYHYLKDALGSVVGLARDYVPSGAALLAARPARKSHSDKEFARRPAPPAGRNPPYSQPPPRQPGPGAGQCPFFLCTSEMEKA